MHVRPEGVTDDSILDAVRRNWDSRVDNVEHLAVGWGAHHWRAQAGPEPVLFVTLDPPTARHTAESIEGAYRAAASLELDFVWPCVPRSDGSFTLPFGGRTLSVTRWSKGQRPSCSTPDLPGMLHALHRAPAPRRAPLWATEVDPRLSEQMARLLEKPWDGPLGPAARALILEHRERLGEWVAEHTMLLERADPAAYVVTHGEPGVHNQWLAQGKIWLIDWESLRLAPRERDLATLVHAGVATDAEPALVRLFDLEWRLQEVWSFACWLQGPHRGDADDRTALGGLEQELTRAHFDEGDALT